MALTTWPCHALRADVALGTPIIFGHPEVGLVAANGLVLESLMRRAAAAAAKLTPLRKRPTQLVNDARVRIHMDVEGSISQVNVIAK